MEISTRVIAFISVLSGVSADSFNYRYSSGNEYGPADWKKVECNDLDSCEGWPDKHESSVGFKLDENQCRWCPETGNKCPLDHRMSPVNLVRDRAIEDNKNWKECPDWHWMNFEDGTCQWDDMKDSFEISKHALQIHTPMRQNGDIDCANAEGERKYPRLDYSKGFPDWWHLDRTDVKVPSEHTQHGKRYAAEISLAHFYEIGHYKNQVGYVTLFMQDYPNQTPWNYLDKLICQWRHEEEKQRKKCGMPPAPVYKMCELYRGQERTSEDLQFDDERGESSATFDQTSQMDRPNAIPIEDFGKNPDDKLLPLNLCQGNCNLTEECAKGLICHRRDPNEAVPGCTGGEENGKETSFCVFDPFGEGYNLQQVNAPTGNPTKTASPTMTQLDPKLVVDLGGTPPADAFPLHRCQGDCDTDNDCADGLVCFQRNSNQAIPGCIGGEQNPLTTDYCVLDIRGEGYTDAPTINQTTPPTAAPTATKVTSTPTVVATKPPTNIPTAVPTKKAPVPFVPRPTGTAKVIWNRGWEPNFMLGECEGDCDNDDDCGPGLICFSRESSRVAVPGCVGGEEDRTLTDYCTYPALDTTNENVAINRQIQSLPPTNLASPTASPVTPPTASPVTPPTASPTASPVTPPTASPTASPVTPPTASPTESPVTVPVTEPVEAPTESPITVPVTEPVEAPTAAPVTAPTTAPTSAPTAEQTNPPTITVEDEYEPVPLNAISWSPPKDKKLTICEGDCDIDDDCADGLVCFQRFTPKTPIPGCIGGVSDTSLMDYCIVDRRIITTIAPVTTATPTVAPVTDLVPDSSAVTRNSDSVPPNIDCKAYEDKGVNMDRFCDNDHQDMCCQSPRSNSNYCHENYEIFGDALKSACHHCCLEERNEAYVVGDANVEKVGLELFTNKQCAEDVDNAARICKDKSCCDPDYSDTRHCRQEMETHKDDWQRICWYCCHPSKDYPLDTARRVLSGTSADELVVAKTEAELRLWHRENPRELGPKDVVFNHTQLQRELIVREENFVEKGLKDEDAYFQEIHGAFQRRELQTPVMENYEDVHWWPYEWLLKVGTEYYYRYEGSMTVPPCYTVNHWRVMKDPIRVAKHQITELERLLAWRINGKCKADTAGKEREGNPDAVDVNRPLQELQKGHRMVFCECQDWPSKFPQERQWCQKWQKRDPELRLFENPYNWQQNGF